MSKQWTPAEDFILGKSKTMSAARLAKLLPGRSVKAIRARRLEVGANRIIRKLWEPEEDELLAELAAEGKNMQEIAEIMGRSADSIKHRMARANENGGDFSYAAKPPEKPGVWPDLPKDAFKDIKVSADPRTPLAKPITRTDGGIGSAML